jgi:hypothetical protein
LRIADGRQVVSLRDERRRAIGQVSAEQHRPRCWRILVVTVPSEPEDSDLPGIEAGIWKIRITRAGKEAQALKDPIRCWIQRDSDPTTLRSGARQSYFDDPRDVRYDLGALFPKHGRLISEASGAPREKDSRAALVRRFGSLNGLAAIPSAISVAGFRLGAGSDAALKQLRPASYSCAGTQRDGWPKVRVSCASMSDRSNVLAGTVAAGVRSGARSVMNGTSAAAPFVARQLATIFVSASDEAVERAEEKEKARSRARIQRAGKDEEGESNYQSLLTGEELARYKSLRRDRFGKRLILPDRQPGVSTEQIALSDDELELVVGQLRRKRRPRRRIAQRQSSSP